MKTLKDQVEADLAQRGIPYRIVGPADFDGPLRQATQAHVLEHLRNAIEKIEHGPLPRRVLAKAKRIEETIEAQPFDAGAARVRLHDMAEDMLTALRDELCLHVPSDRRAVFNDADTTFGLHVLDLFPDAAADISSAAHCLALDQPTASVFHCMRVLGHGLHRLADRFEVRWEAQTWHRVISDIEAKIFALRNAPDRTSEVRKDVSAYSEAASQFRYFKDAWRTYVANEGPTYDADEAQIIFSHTRDFMRAMAKLIGPALATTTDAV